MGKSKKKVKTRALGNKRGIKKKPKLIEYFSLSNLLTEVHSYGYDFSIGSFFKILFVCFAALAAIGYLYGLKIEYLSIVCVFFILMLPSIIRSVFRGMYEQKKFLDTGNYIEQVLYSFKRHTKIIDSLQDTLILFPDGKLHDCIEQAIEFIIDGKAEEDLYSEALAIIEEEYGCQRVYSAHNFMRRVELNGGESEESSDILIVDRNRWIDRVWDAQKDKDVVKRNMTISVFMSMILVAFTVLMIPSEFAVKEQLIPQVATTAVMVANIWLWSFVQRRLSGSWVRDETETTFEDIKHSYNLVMHPKEKKKDVNKVVAIIVIVAGIAYSIKGGNIIYGGLAVLFGYILATNQSRIYKKSKKRVAKEVNKEFPQWMLNIALLLQTNNVQVSIARSLDDAPEVLREELERLLDGMQKDTNSIEPYLSFFHQVDVPEVQSAMKMLYSLAAFGDSDMESQIGSIVERNSKMMDKADKQRSEDFIATISFMVMIPMITGSVKMIVDMVILVTSLLTMTAL